MQRLIWATVGVNYLLIILQNAVTSLGLNEDCPMDSVCSSKLGLFFSSPHLPLRALSFAAAVELLLLVATVSKILVLPKSIYPTLKRKAALLVAVFGAQIVTGRNDTFLSLPFASPFVSSTLQFFLSLLFFSLLLSIAFSVTPLQPSHSEAHPKIRRLALAGIGGLAFQFLLGILQRALQGGLACPEFPLCAESFFPSPFDLTSAITFIHRWWGILLLGLFVHLALFSAKKAPELASTTRRALGFAIAQVLLGIGTVLGQLHSHSRITHAAMGFALWGTLLWIVHQVVEKKTPAYQAQPGTLQGEVIATS